MDDGTDSCTDPTGKAEGPACSPGPTLEESGAEPVLLRGDAADFVDGQVFGLAGEVDLDR